NKLRQEKILTYNEIIYNQCKQLIDENLNHWKMDKSENLYYILSGYSYSSTKAILNSKKENNEEKENEGGNVNEQ
ncbi:TM1802 family CRISPR-associated protein, partial [Clostridium cochlearium]